MTTQELFEGPLQDQHDLFQIIRNDYDDKIKQFPIKDVGMILSEDPNDTDTAKMAVNEWIQSEILPLLEQHFHLSQKQALKTVASWIGAMGISK